MKRRSFIGSSAFAALAASLPLEGRPQKIFLRKEIAQFSTDAALVKAFRDGVRAMRNNADAKDVTSWEYWHNSHKMTSGTAPPDMTAVWNKCKHHELYFFQWHRGFLYYFEQMVRQLSKNADFALPYWDYYLNPEIPEIFADETLSDKTSNPLYWENRANNEVYGLTYSAFSNAITQFPFSDSLSRYENSCQYNPHDIVHGAIGGSMGSFGTSALDPVFWVHHCNIDRLWAAWITARNGRKMPPADDKTYWSASWIWNTAGTWNKTALTLDNTVALGYTYDDLSLPEAPPDLMLPAQSPSTLRADRMEHWLVFGAENLSLLVPIAPALQPTLRAFTTSPLAQRNEAYVVALDGVNLTAAGRRGGYVFNVYMNLPTVATPESADTDAAYYLGPIDSFTISVAQMMQPGPATLTFPASLALQLQARRGPLNLEHVALTFVRAPAEAAPVASAVVTIDAIRFERVEGSAHGM
jgi:tyrosinase